MRQAHFAAGKAVSQVGGGAICSAVASPGVAQGALNDSITARRAGSRCGVTLRQPALERHALGWRRWGALGVGVLGAVRCRGPQNSGSRGPIRPG